MKGNLEELEERRGPERRVPGSENVTSVLAGQRAKLIAIHHKGQWAPRISPQDSSQGYGPLAQAWPLGPSLLFPVISFLKS